ncbi:Sodium/hydrogen exchanger family [Musa troglodytarum]|uniref:Sodium/hydrogen exchanger family n=1 Tax=Musa troglodytarum TaxID=320322 RepID=A0A9E7JZ06_9LILI|nr:Sodium/hydrogen exchanger family [Musa troglodytarum]
MITAVKTPGTAIGIVASLAGSLLFVLLVARPTLMWSVRRTPAGETLVEWHFLVLLMTALLMSLATQAFGYNVTLGPLMLGLAIPGGMPVGQTIKEKLEPLGGELFLPMYIVLAGYRTRFEEVRNMKAWGVLEMVVVICYVGKLVGSVAMSRYFDMSANDAISVGLMLNIKGIVEISAFNTYTWGDSQIASTEHFSVLTVSMMVITAVTTPLIKLLYKPTMRYVARKRRTVEHARPRSLLRFMACVHNEEHVAPSSTSSRPPTLAATPPSPSPSSTSPSSLASPPRCFVPTSTAAAPPTPPPPTASSMPSPTSRNNRLSQGPSPSTLLSLWRRTPPCTTTSAPSPSTAKFASSSSPSTSVVTAPRRP